MSVQRIEAARGFGAYTYHGAMSGVAYTTTLGSRAQYQVLRLRAGSPNIIYCTRDTLNRIKC